MQFLQGSYNDLSFKDVWINNINAQKKDSYKKH